MKVQLPSKPFLTKSLALKAAQTVKHLTNSQICDCIEVLSSLTLSVQEKQQSRVALLLMLAAAVSLGKWKVARGRPVGFSPINGEDGAMTKKNKAWSMPDDDWEWLESQPNQSEIIRSAIAFYRQNR